MSPLRRGGILPVAWLVLGALLAAGCGAPGQTRAPEVWTLDDPTEAGGHPFRIEGEPRIEETPAGAAAVFDGDDDAYFVDVNPLEGAAAFTVEVVFRPDPGGAKEQRFIHMQETGSKDRALLETRPPGDGTWFLDTYVKTGGEGHTLFARKYRHPLGAWYHAALVVDGEEMRHYVNGELEMDRSIDFRPQGPGRTSVGVRINRVDWFRGAIRELRITHAALAPRAFSIPEIVGQSPGTDAR